METEAADAAEQLSQDSIVEETSQSSGSTAAPQKASKAQYKITAPWAEDVKNVSDIPIPGQERKKEKEPKKKRKRKKKESHAPATVTQESLMGNFPEMEFPRTLRNITNNGEHAPLLQQGGERRQLSQVLSAIAGMASQNKAKEQTISAPLLPEVKYYGHDPSYSSKLAFKETVYFLKGMVQVFNFKCHAFLKELLLQETKFQVTIKSIKPCG